MNPLVFAILSWEKELEIQKERHALRRTRPETDAPRPKPPEQALHATGGRSDESQSRDRCDHNGVIRCMATAGPN